MSALRETIKRILRRFKHEDFEFITDNWSVFRSRNFDLSAVGRTKTKLISALLVHINGHRITKNEVAELDLLYVSQWTYRKHWQVFKLLEMPGFSCSVAGLSPKDLKDKMFREMKRFRYKCHVHVLLRDEGLWMRVEVLDSETKTLTVRGATYVVYYAGSPYSYITNLRRRYANCILQALCNVFNCKAVSKMALDGPCIRSLQHIVTAQSGQELSTSLAEKVSKRGQKRKRNFNNETFGVHDDRICDEEAESKRQRRDYIVSRLGAGPQPVLETLKYQLHTKFAGVAHAANMQSDQPFGCDVSLKGTSVIEGIREMVEAGIIDTELPNYVANIKTLRRNKLLIRPKSAPSGNG